MGTTSDKISQTKRLILCVYFGPTYSIEFVRYISRKYPTFFARVFLSDLEYDLSDIYILDKLWSKLWGAVWKKTIRFVNHVCGALFGKKR